jgi:cytochrome c-type biogenesis protein CcmH
MLREQPNDLKGWLMLGRSYDCARIASMTPIVAYEHAHQLDAKNVEATMGLGEALSMRAGGEITPQAAELFEQRPRLEPAIRRRCCTAGFGSGHARRSVQLARTRWERSKP